METPNGAYEPFELVLTNRTPEAMSGAIATVVRPFAKPRALGGQVTVGTWDKKWMPPCDHVLYLHDGACDRGDTRKALFMFVTVENGAVVRVQGTAPRVVKSWFLARHDLNLEGQRLAGTVTVLHRPDKWSWPLVESGRTAAARYSIDVDVANPGKARTYTGTWGVEWEDRRPLNARIIPDTECPQ
jgi:hypothetical protein